MDVVREIQNPDQGWMQRYDVVKELGDCYASVGDYENARRYYEQAAWLEPDEAGPYVGTGVIELQQGHLEDARIAFRVALRLDGCDSKAHAGLAMIAQQTGAPQEAFDAYLKSLELDYHYHCSSRSMISMLKIIRVGYAYHYSSLRTNHP